MWKLHPKVKEEPMSGDGTAAGGVETVFEKTDGARTPSVQDPEAKLDELLQEQQRQKD